MPLLHHSMVNLSIQRALPRVGIPLCCCNIEDSHDMMSYANFLQYQHISRTAHLKRWSHVPACDTPDMNTQDISSVG